MASQRADGLRSAVAIMAKAPRPGKVKTRLCPPLSNEEAAELYRCFLLDKIAQVNVLQKTALIVSYGPPLSKPLFEDLVPSHCLLVPQRGADLGARLLSTFIQLFRQGFEQVMAVDSDTPTLPNAYLEQALDLMARPEIDMVLGPTEDGGYYLIGLRRAHRALFEEMPWSTSHVLPETLRRSEAQGLNVACTASWFDIDTPEDLKRLAASLATAENGQAQYTREFLREYRW